MDVWRRVLDEGIGSFGIILGFPSAYWSYLLRTRRFLHKNLKKWGPPFPHTPSPCFVTRKVVNCDIKISSDERKRRNRNCRSYLCSERAWMPPLSSGCRRKSENHWKSIELFQTENGCVAFCRSFCALRRFLFPRIQSAQLFWESSRVQRAHGKNSSLLFSATTASH